MPHHGGGHHGGFRRGGRRWTGGGGYGPGPWGYGGVYPWFISAYPYYPPEEEETTRILRIRRGPNGEEEVWEQVRGFDPEQDHETLVHAGEIDEEPEGLMKVGHCAPGCRASPQQRVLARRRIDDLP